MTDKTKNNLIKLAILAVAAIVFMMIFGRCSEEDVQPSVAKIQEPKVKAADQITISVRVLSGECFQDVVLNAWVDKDDLYEAAADLTCDSTKVAANGLKTLDLIEINIYPKGSDKNLVKAVKAAQFEYTIVQNGETEVLVGNCGCTADGSVKYFVK